VNVGSGAVVALGGGTVQQRDAVRGHKAGGNIVVDSENVYVPMWERASREVDLSELAAELRKLGEGLRSAPDAGQHAAEIHAVEEAATAAQANDGPRALERLKAAGAWVFDVGRRSASESLSKWRNAPSGLYFDFCHQTL
jgi:hypothetical protein